jgi:hypothetical protein
MKSKRKCLRLRVGVSCDTMQADVMHLFAFLTETTVYFYYIWISIGTVQLYTCILEYFIPTRKISRPGLQSNQQDLIRARRTVVGLLVESHWRSRLDSRLASVGGLKGEVTIYPVSPPRQSGQSDGVDFDF